MTNGRSRSRNGRNGSWFSRVFGGRSEAIPMPVKVQEDAPTTPSDDLFFECQLAHGSPTAKIRGVSGHKKMYESIARAFKLDPADILYCTVNTYKLEMDKLLSSAIPLDCLIFAHVRGQKKQVVLKKENGHLGLTITDNHAGHVFIKNIKPNSTCGRATPAVAVGDLVECVNGERMVGKRHVDVAKLLRSLPIGENITLRLVSPMSSGFAAIGERSVVRPQLPTGGGNQTLRFFADGPSIVQQEAVDKKLLATINSIFEEYLGVHDDDLALSIWELGRECGDMLEMRERLHQSAHLAPFEFPDELIFDMWGVVSDQKNQNMPIHINVARSAAPNVSVHPAVDSDDDTTEE